MILRGSVVKGPNGNESDRLPNMRECVSEDLIQFDGNGTRFVDDVGSRQSAEPAVDFIATAILHLTSAVHGD